jgi:thioredoxin-related protein
MKKTLACNLKWLLCFVFIAFAINGYSQDDGKDMPPFHIVLTNGNYLKAKDVRKNTPSMLVYFSPTCEHCQNFTKKMTENISSLSQVQIIMISYLPYRDIKKFEADFGLAKYPNIKVGTEGYTFVVQKYYDIRNFPFLALFNKNGKPITTYATAPDISEIIKKFKAS